MDWIQLRSNIVVDVKEIVCVHLDRLSPPAIVKDKTHPYLLKCLMRGDGDDYFGVETEYIDEVLDALNLEIKEDKNGCPILSIVPPGQRALRSLGSHVCISNQPED